MPIVRRRVAVAGLGLICGAGMVVGTVSKSAAAKHSFTLDNTRWNVKASVVRKPKFMTASGFREVLFFRNGTVYGQVGEKQVLDLTPYSSGRIKGSKTDLKWSFQQITATSDKFDWQGTVRPQRRGSWIMKGMITRTTPDGQVYQYRLRGMGRRYTPAVPEVTSSGK